MGYTQRESSSTTPTSVMQSTVRGLFGLIPMQPLPECDVGWVQDNVGVCLSL